MNESQCRDWLTRIQAGEVCVEEAMVQLRKLPFEDLGFAKVDHHRSLRCGFPEVIYCEGKSSQQVAVIFQRCAEADTNVLATRASHADFKAVEEKCAEAMYDATARMITLRQQEQPKSVGVIAIAAAGTSDIPVAEEARITAEIMDQTVQTFYDVGVAGLHRLLTHTEALQSANVIIVVAGMEGALPSVVGGLVDCPIIAVPTSIGYGASFNGLAALLAMLNSCAAGVSVVNIDNGFGAGYSAALINRRSQPLAKRESP